PLPAAGPRSGEARPDGLVVGAGGALPDVHDSVLDLAHDGFLPGRAARDRGGGLARRLWPGGWSLEDRAAALPARDRDDGDLRREVAPPTGRRRAVEVELPLGRALAPREPLRRIRRERLQDVSLDPTVPRHELARLPSPPAPVDQAVDRVDVEAAHLREPALAAEHAGAVLLPVDDVGEGVLHRPLIASRRSWHP